MTSQIGIGGIIFDSTVRTVKGEELGKLVDETARRQRSSWLYLKKS